jgi:hypothetical protein
MGGCAAAGEGVTKAEIARRLGIGEASVYRILWEGPAPANLTAG